MFVFPAAPMLLRFLSTLPDAVTRPLKKYAKFYSKFRMAGKQPLKILSDAVVVVAGIFLS